MTYGHNPVLEKIANLNTFRSGERRAPHKPLLLLIGIGALTRARHELTYAEIEKSLTPLLNAYAPPVRSRHQPQLPYWHLRSDKLWIVDGAESFPLQAGGFPKMGALRKSSGRLSDDIVEFIESDPDSISIMIKMILNDHFPPSIHEDLVAAVGLELPKSQEVRDQSLVRTVARYRDPKFRQSVLRAYEHRCAVTGFRAALGGSFVGCEAAHVRWHAYNGPDLVSNGIALEPTIHKLFDVGAWTLTDDRRILVSREFTGSDSAVEKVRSLHGRAIRDPLQGEPKIEVEFIRWHREPDLGGVFRSPALN
ncbi:phosphorothioated DNA-binding restriction endonuclease [Acaryochloris marina NIES-2412]|uniref:phosphorothioated DNA-binding restriction endonuclease n=1 Tax=Acaryochloris marina TaxID=155978 RepID=UPI00405A06AF